MTIMEILLIGTLIAMGVGMLIIQYELLCIAKYLDDIHEDVKAWIYIVYKKLNEGEK